MIVLAIFALSAVLAARAYASPYDHDDRLTDVGDSDWLGEPQSVESVRPRIEVPIELRGAPPVSAVLAAAYRTAGLAADPVPSWRLRSRLATLIPWVSARRGQDEYWREVIDPTITHAIGYDVRVAWHLERLLFDSNEPRFEMLDLARRRERRRLSALVIHRYFDWLAARSANAAVETAETAAELDALTDGWFSETAKAAEPR